MDVINCQCKTVGKACNTQVCSSNSAGLSCISYCFCGVETVCCYPFTKHGENEAIYAIDGKGDSTAEIKYGAERERGLAF